MTFAEDLARLPVAANTPEASGFLPPIFRASGHLLFVLGQAADEEIELTEENEAELISELRHAKGHWDAINANDALSAAAVAHLGNFGAALDSAIAEFTRWDRPTKLRNTRDLANRIVSYAATLDRELVGLPASSAGTNF
jgi:hypothetical protein